MTPKVRIFNDEIINAAFELVKEGGWSNFTAKKIAHKLNCSVHPLYREHKSLMDIKRAVIRMMVELSSSYTLKEHTTNPLANIIIGGLNFAFDYPKLQTAIMELGPEFTEDLNPTHVDTIQSLQDDPFFKDVSKNRVLVLYEHAMFYSHGFASVICSGALEGVASREQLIELALEGIDILQLVTRSDIEYNKKIRLRPGNFNFEEDQD